MRYNVMILLAVVGLVFLSTTLLDRRSERIHNNLPVVTDFTFTDLKNKTSSLYKQKNPIILIHFWATWCGPCLVEFPTLMDRIENMKNVTLIAVSVDKDKNALEKFLKAYPQNRRLHYVFDPDRKIAGQFGVKQFPETLVLGRGHRLHQHIAGVADWTRFQFPED